MCGFYSDFFLECKSKSISGGFIHQAGIFGVKCFKTEISLVASLDMIVSNKRITKALIRLCGYLNNAYKNE